MIYNKQNYNFIEGTTTRKDTAPEWMDSLFENLVNPSLKEEKIAAKTAQIFKTEIKQHHCNCCGNKLAENEVTFCKNCIKDSLQ